MVPPSSNGTNGTSNGTNSTNASNASNATTGAGDSSCESQKYLGCNRLFTWKDEDGTVERTNATIAWIVSKAQAVQTQHDEDVVAIQMQDAVCSDAGTQGWDPSCRDLWF